MTTASSPVADAVFALAKSRLPVALETKFSEFPIAMIDVHGKDLTVSGDPSRSGTPAPPANSVTSPGSSVPPVPSALGYKSAKHKPELNPISTSTITLNANFMASADDLFSLLTDEKRIPTWTRNPAKVLPIYDVQSVFTDIAFHR
jgi:activator of HSP90 ATPase